MIWLPNHHLYILAYLENNPSQKPKTQSSPLKDHYFSYHISWSSSSVLYYRLLAVEAQMQWLGFAFFRSTVSLLLLQVALLGMNSSVDIRVCFVFARLFASACHSSFLLGSQCSDWPSSRCAPPFIHIFLLSIVLIPISEYCPGDGSLLRSGQCCRRRALLGRQGMEKSITIGQNLGFFFVFNFYLIYLLHFLF